MYNETIKTMLASLERINETCFTIGKLIERLTARLSLLEDVVLDLQNKRNVDEGLDTVECLGNVDCTKHGRPHTVEDERKSRL